MNPQNVSNMEINFESPPRRTLREHTEDLSDPPNPPDPPDPPNPPGAPRARRTRGVEQGQPGPPLLSRRDVIRNQLLSRMTERRNRTSNTLVDHQRDLSTAIAVDTLIDFFDEIGVESRHWEGESGASMANRNRVALMSTIEAYTPADPIPYPEKVEDIHQPEPVAETEEHRAVCNAIDACDEYNGPLDVAPEPSFLCPISHSAYRAPVCAPDGHIYEKTYI